MKPNKLLFEKCRLHPLDGANVPEPSSGKSQ